MYIHKTHRRQRNKVELFH